MIYLLRAGSRVYSHIGMQNTWWYLVLEYYSGSVVLCDSTCALLTGFCQPGS